MLIHFKFWVAWLVLWGFLCLVLFGVFLVCALFICLFLLCVYVGVFSWLVFCFAGFVCFGFCVCVLFVLSCRGITSMYRVSPVGEIWELQFNNPLCKCHSPGTSLQLGRRGVRAGYRSGCLFPSDTVFHVWQKLHLELNFVLGQGS